MISDVSVSLVYVRTIIFIIISVNFDQLSNHIHPRTYGVFDIMLSFFI